MNGRVRRAVILLAVVAASVALIVASLFIGAETLSLERLQAEWHAGRPIAESPALSVLFNQRMPRTLAALIAGAGLAVAGCAFQALLRNPLATPYTLGIASAGAFGAWTATILLQAQALHGLAAFSFLGFSAVQVFAFVFAGIDVLFIYGLAVRQKRISPTVLLLAGVTMGMVANAGILMMRYLARPDRLVSMDRWLMGGVDVLGYEPVQALFIGVTPCLAVLLFQAGKYDQLGFSPEMAAGRGINVQRLQTLTFVVGSLMTAIIVSKVGPIGFVGLIVPHSCRALVGARHKVLLPVCLVAGGGFLCFCDIIARKLLPGETPIGIITALIGGPFFLYLLVRGRFTAWDA